MKMTLRALRMLIKESVPDDVEGAMKKGLFFEGGLSHEEALLADDITPDEAKREIEKHGLRWDDFIRDVGLKRSYAGQEVLGWIGY